MSSANLTGRTSGRPGGPVALRCPGCAKEMTPVELEELGAEVDVCDHCGGIWLDWFDGELRALATETLRVSSTDLSAAADDEEAAPLSKRSAEVIGACPRDHRQLVAERYIVTVEVAREGRPDKTSLIPGKPTAAELLRCEDCMGSFVTRASAQVLAFLDRSDEAPASQGPMSRARPLPWERFTKVVKAWLGADAKRRSLPPKK